MFIFWARPFAAAIAGLIALGVVSNSVAARYLSMDGSVQLAPVAPMPGQRVIHIAEGSEGAQLVLAGRTVDLSAASALVGSSSDTIYVAVARGAARVDGLSASEGQAILLPAMGAAPSVVTFDAERVAALFGSQPPAALQGFLADLNSAAEDQALGLFFGLYERTVLDLHAPGGARIEAGRASVMGAPEVARVRYSGVSDPDQIEEMVVKRAASALAAGDASALAQLLDPAPYGGDDLTGGGDGARLVVAQNLVAEFGRAASGEVRRGASQGVWRAGSVTLRTRPFSDFVFISAVE